MISRFYLLVKCTAPNMILPPGRLLRNWKVNAIPGQVVSLGVPGCPRVSQGVPGCPRVSQGVPGCPRESQGTSNITFNYIMYVFSDILC